MKRELIFATDAKSLKAAVNGDSGGCADKRLRKAASKLRQCVKPEGNTMLAWIRTEATVADGFTKLPGLTARLLAPVASIAFVIPPSQRKTQAKTEPIPALATKPSSQERHLKFHSNTSMYIRRCWLLKLAPK